MWCPFYILIPQEQDVTQNKMKNGIHSFEIFFFLLAVLEITAKEISPVLIFFRCKPNMFLFSRDYMKHIVLNLCL